MIIAKAGGRSPHRWPPSKHQQPSARIAVSEDPSSHTPSPDIGQRTASPRPGPRLPFLLALCHRCSISAKHTLPPFWTAAHPSASCVQTALQRMICAYRSSPLCTRGAATRGRARWRTRCLRDPSWRCGLASGVPRRRAVAAGQPRLPSTRGAQVDAHPVLCCLGLRYPPARRLDEGPADGGVLVHVRPRAAARDLASASASDASSAPDLVAPGMLAKLAASARRSPELALPQCPQVHATTHPARPAITERGPAVRTRSAL
jgi:hypothetical protein